MSVFFYFFWGGALCYGATSFLGLFSDILQFFLPLVRHSGVFNGKQSKQLRGGPSMRGPESLVHYP